MSTASLLIVLGEPHYDTQIRPILDRILEGLTVWDQDKSTVDLNTELLNFINKNVPPEKVEGGIILRSEGKIFIEVLVHPTVALLTQTLQNFLYQTSNYKLIVHAGPAYQGTGSWILRDGTFSLHDFARFIHKNEISSVLKEREASTTTISCLNEGEWNENGFKLHDLKRYSIKIQEKGNQAPDLQCSNNVVNYFNRYVTYVNLTELMPSSNIVGSVRFRRPTIYMFPAGQGDAALFGVSGFTMLLDGGYQWKSCFWDFLRHVDRIDALLVSRLNANTINGAHSFVKRLSMQADTHPKLGYAFMNAPSRQSSASGPTSTNPLLVSTFDQTFDLVDALARLSLEPHPLSFSISPSTKHPEPLTLYQKVGHGRLEMYVLNPAKDSKELNDYVKNWKNYATPPTSSQFSIKPGTTTTVGGSFPVPISAQTSVAALLVWHPANAQENVIRVLYPGSCPQERVLSALDKLKHLEFLKHPACTPASLEGGKGVKGTPARKPMESMAKLASPTPKPSANHQNHSTGNQHVQRSSPSPTANHLHVDAETAKSALHAKVEEAPKSPKVEASLEVSAPSMVADAEHQLSSKVLEQHSLSAAAVQPPPAAPEHQHNQSFTPPKSPDLFMPNDKPHSPAVDHDDLYVPHAVALAAATAVAPVDAVAAGHALDDFAAVQRDHFANHGGGGALIDDDLLGGAIDHEHHRGDHPISSSKPELIPETLIRTEENTSDIMSPLSPANSEESRMKESPVDPVQHPTHEFDSFSHPPSSHSPNVDLFSNQYSPSGGGAAAAVDEQLNSQMHVFETEPRPRSNPGGLNPEAPEFVPRTSLSSDDATDMIDAAHKSVSPSAMSPTDPIGVVNGGGVFHPDVPGGDHSSFHSKPGPMTMDDGAAVFQHNNETTAMKNVDDLMKDWDQPSADSLYHPHDQQQQNQERKKSLDDLMKEWGKPLGAPPPPNSKLNTSVSTAPGAAAKKPAAAATAAKSSAADAKAKPSSAGPAKKPTTGAAAASTKPTNGADAKPHSVGASTAKKPSAPAPKPSAPAAKPSAPAAAKSTAAPAKPTANKLSTSTVAKSATAAPAAAKTTPISAPKAPAPKPSTPSTAPKLTSTSTPIKSQSSSTAKKPTSVAGVAGPPYYVDLTYIPHNGNPHFVNSDFFKNVRSKYYVLSALQAPKEVLDALLTGKKSWNLPEEEVTLIPTYDSDTLNLWMSLHRDELSMESVDVAPSCARCSLNLEEHHDTVCAAYRLEL